MNYTSNPTAEETNELSVLLTEERHARTLANIARRAETLWDDGYALADSVIAGLKYVTSPTGAEYQVNVGTGLGNDCDCPAFPKYGTCKHFLAVPWKMREEAEAAAFDAMMANAEAATGCDPYAEL